MKSLDKTIKRVALINDMSCFGKCSLTVSVPIISAFGCETVPLPTALLSTHTGEFRGYTKLDLSVEMKKIISHWEELNLGFDCIYTGYFCSIEQIDLTIEFIKKFKRENTVVIVDPVMGDNGSLYDGFSEEFAEKIKYYLEHEEERQRIVDAGYERLMRDGHEVGDRIEFIMEQYALLKNT